MERVKLHRMLLLLGVLAAAHAQDGVFSSSVKSRRTPWTHLKFPNQAAEFQFAVIGDRTGGHKPGAFLPAMDRLNLLRPEFVLSVGDLIEGYTENEPEILRQWAEFHGFVNALEMPFFYLVGSANVCGTSGLGSGTDEAARPDPGGCP